MEAVGIRRFWGLSCLCITVIMLILAFLPYSPLPDTPPGGPMMSNTKAVIALFFYTLTGLPWACKMVIPYALIARTYKGSPDLGLYTATLNISLCMSQFGVSVISPIIIGLADHRPSAS